MAPDRIYISCCQTNTFEYNSASTGASREGFQLFVKEFRSAAPHGFRRDLEKLVDKAVMEIQSQAVTKISVALTAPLQQA